MKIKELIKTLMEYKQADVGFSFEIDGFEYYTDEILGIKQFSSLIDIHLADPVGCSSSAMPEPEIGEIIKKVEETIISRMARGSGLASFLDGRYKRRWFRLWK